MERDGARILKADPFGYKPLSVGDGRRSPLLSPDLNGEGTIRFPPWRHGATAALQQRSGNWLATSNLVQAFASIKAAGG
jgi:hypothetical protein